MALSFTNYSLFIDPFNQVALKDYGDLAQLPQMVFTDGDKARLEVYIIRQTNIPDVPMEILTFPTGTVKLQVGTPGSAELISTTTATSLTATTISAGTVGSNLSPFTVGDGAVSGYFSVTITNSSPALSCTTRFLQYPIDKADMEAAIEAAVNGQSGWSLADCQVLQTGISSGTISLVATQGGTVRQISGVTSNITFTSNLVGLDGRRFTLDFSAAAIGTFLGTETSKDATLEVSVTDSGDKQTYIQLPITIRAEVE